MNDLWGRPPGTIIHLERTACTQVRHSTRGADWVMDIAQLIMTVGALVGVLLVGLLAVVPSLLDLPA